MAKTIYIGVAGAARKVKKVYIGVAGIARAVKKGFIGAVNLARQFFASVVVPVYDGYAADLNVTAQMVAVANTLAYVFFAGGIASAAAAVVTAYNAALARSAPASLGLARLNLAGATNGTHAIFGGGMNASGVSVTNVDAYQNNLAKVSSVTALSVARYSLAGARAGNNAVFAGGYTSTTGALRNTVDYYNASLGRNTTTLNEVKSTPAAVAFQNCAFFGGGQAATNPVSYRSTVEGFNANMGRVSMPNLSTQRSNASAAALEDYAFFMGGSGSGGYSNAVDVYNKSFGKVTSVPALSQARERPAAFALGDCVLAVGGGLTSNGASTAVDMYSKDLAKLTTAGLTAGRRNATGGAVGNYGLAAGGANASGTPLSTVEKYAIK